MAHKNKTNKTNKPSKTFVLDFVNQVRNGRSIESITFEPMRLAVEKEIGKQVRESRKTQTETLYGLVKKETEKAVLFANRDGGESWWPKSQVNLLERAMGNLDSLEVPSWLFAEKMEVA